MPGKGVRILILKQALGKRLDTLNPWPQMGRSDSSPIKENPLDRCASETTMAWAGVTSQRSVLQQLREPGANEGKQRRRWGLRVRGGKTNAVTVQARSGLSYANAWMMLGEGRNNIQ